MSLSMQLVAWYKRAVVTSQDRAMYRAGFGCLTSAEMMRVSLCVSAFLSLPFSASVSQCIVCSSARLIGLLPTLGPIFSRYMRP